jgi:hypothetical protein
MTCRVYVGSGPESIDSTSLKPRFLFIRISLENALADQGESSKERAWLKACKTSQAPGQDTSILQSRLMPCVCTLPSQLGFVCQTGFSFYLRSICGGFAEDLRRTKLLDHGCDS